MPPATAPPHYHWACQRIWPLLMRMWNPNPLYRPIAFSVICHIRRLRCTATARCRGSHRAEPRQAPVSHHRLWRLPLENHRGRPRYPRSTLPTRLCLVPMYHPCPDSPRVSYLFHRTGSWPRFSYIKTSYADTCKLVRISSSPAPILVPSKSSPSHLSRNLPRVLASSLPGAPSS